MSETSYRVDHEDLSQQVYHMLKHMILVGELKTGEKLNQDDLANRLGVSRTPLLSAFAKLEKEMLVETLPRRGAFVKKYELVELVNIYEIRVRLEPYGAALAARNGTDEEKAELLRLCAEFENLAPQQDPRIKEIDYEFHMQITHMSRNQLLFNIISSFSIIPIANFYGFFKEPQTSSSEHREVCEAILTGDVQRARAQMFQHTNSSLKHLVEHIARRDSQ